MQDREIRAAIAEYAAAYHRLQEIQERSRLMPEGDQKTGCIGEYYAYTFLKSQYGENALRYGNHSEKGWDIEVALPQPLRVQVKTASEYSRTRTLSPIHAGWNRLFVFLLDRAFVPVGFWVVEESDISGICELPLKCVRCPRPESAHASSRGLSFGANRVGELHSALGSG